MKLIIYDGDVKINWTLPEDDLGTNRDLESVKESSLYFSYICNML